MLDEDLARIYGVTTKRLNEQVRRNADRFPLDFAFSLNAEELRMLANLKSQFATSSLQATENIKYSSIHSKFHGGRRKMPWVFTEHGAVMLASVLNSPVAVHASIEVVRAFIRIRDLVTHHKDLAHKIDELERKYDGQFRVVFDAIRELMTPAITKKPGSDFSEPTCATRTG